LEVGQNGQKWVGYKMFVKLTTYDVSPEWPKTYWLFVAINSQKANNSQTDFGYCRSRTDLGLHNSMAKIAKMLLAIDEFVVISIEYLFWYTNSQLIILGPFVSYCFYYKI